MILVTGAAGQVGIALLKALAAKGIDVRAWIHKDSESAAVRAAGAKEVYVGNLTSRSDMLAAMAGADLVYYICNAFNPDEARIGTELIEVAKRNGNTTFAYHSVMHSVLTSMPHHRRKLEMETRVVDSGLPFVIIQPAVFMQMLVPSVWSVLQGGAFTQKFYINDQTRMSFVSLDDYARAAAEIISTGTFVYGTYELCSDGTYSLSDLVSILTEVCGHDVPSVFISDEDFLKRSGMKPDSYAGETVLEMFRHYNEYGFCGNGFTLNHILGHAPKNLREFMQELHTAK